MKFWRNFCFDGSNFCFDEEIFASMGEFLLRWLQFLLRFGVFQYSNEKKSWSKGYHFSIFASIWGVSVFQWQKIVVKRVPFFNFCFDLGCFSIPMKKYKIYYFRNLHFFCTFLAHPYVFIIPISALFDETFLPRAFYIMYVLFGILTFNLQK